MEQAIERIFQQAVIAHKAGKLQDAGQHYKNVLQANPLHPDANHNLGVLAVSINKSKVALPFLETALRVAPQIEQFWLTYIEALIKDKQFKNAKQTIIEAEKKGFPKNSFAKLKLQMGGIKQQKCNVSKIQAPEEEQLKYLLNIYNSGSFADAHMLAISMTEEFPNHFFGWKILSLLLRRADKLTEAVTASKKCLQLAPGDAEAHNNLAVIYKIQGEFTKAEECLRRAIDLKPDYAEAYVNLGNAISESFKITEAKTYYEKAIALKPNFAEAFWNFAGIAKTIKEAETCIDKCLIADPNHKRACFIKSALSLYQGDTNDFEMLMSSEHSDHSYMRSISWVANLPKLPELYYNKWLFFEAMIEKSITSRPFYEFGVWRASSFKFLIKSFKKGYGFDTFTGLPENWDVGDRVEKQGTYTSEGNVPQIIGGEFIVGKFEDTLPLFFQKTRPLASLINFDADLYSSTICALTLAKPVIDEDTILIFDEFLMNESWEQDEFKALEEFCSINNCDYEVLAVSFFTKQVAVKLLGI